MSVCAWSGELCDKCKYKIEDMCLYHLWNEEREEFPNFHCKDHYVECPDREELKAAKEAVRAGWDDYTESQRRIGNPQWEVPMFQTPERWNRFTARSLSI